MSEFKDFPDFLVGNIRCSHCDEAMMFSELNSSDENPVFYCINEKCVLDHFMVRYDEVRPIKLENLEKL